MPESNDHLVTMSNPETHIEVHPKERGLFERMADSVSMARCVGGDLDYHVALPHSNVTINNY